MRFSKSIGAGFLVACSALIATGCGESVVTALSKVANGQLSQLSANEIKFLNQAAIDFGKKQEPPVNVPPLNDAQAAAVSSFLKANNINTKDDIDKLIAAAKNGQNLPKGLEDLAAAFPNGNIDPNNFNPDALASVFSNTVGGGGGA